MWVSKSFLFAAKFVDWRTQGFIFHCPANGHPDCFQFGKIVNKDDMNMLYNTSCEHMLSLHLGKYLGVKLLSRGLDVCLCVHAQSLQSCPTVCNPMDCSAPGSSVRGDSPGKNTGVSCHALLQGIYPTQGSSPCLLHCGQILYRWATRKVQVYM